MPTYDYACPDCGRTAEVFQKARDEAPFTCGAVVWLGGHPGNALPATASGCKGTMRRVMSAPAVPPSGTYSCGR